MSKKSATTSPVQAGEAGVRPDNVKPEKVDFENVNFENVNFESALVELEALVRKLEAGELSLDESLLEFRRGVELTRRCQSVLDRAQQTVEQLLNPEDEGSAQPFAADD